MGESKLDKQTTMVTKPSTNRKPLSNLTNIVRNPNHTSSSIQSKKPVSSTASDSSIGSTQNPINKPHRLTADHLVGEENQTVQGRRRSSQNTRSKATATVPLFQASSHVGKNNVKEGSVSFCSSTLDKVKDQEKISRFCLDKTINDGKKISVTPRNSSTENTNNSKDNRKSTDMPLSGHPMKTVINSTEKDKGKENVVQSAYPFKGNANSNTGLTMPDLMKRKDKGKAIAEPIDYPSRKKLRNSMMDFSGPLKGVVIKEREDTVTGSGSVSLVQKDKGKGVSTPINYHALEKKKKDQQNSCPPILRTTSDSRGVADGTEYALHSKLQTEPPPNKKKRRCPTKEIDEAYALPKEYVEQQRAYFKEIDDFELEVEEV
ncbi:hypothetical protein M8C21_019760 [Ambrosia artemisiifolia]|uniref:Sororin C-terminal region domain-containing protein n=1 Tax=Ambrosia artemisiifolia TaxID=4212 RepID=A0AAD5GP22_AMBAR|nr:hypothetical protein M8C21_019760 [Ambrosia artemisiifolia]